MAVFTTTIIIINKKAAAVTSCDGLNLVSTTVPLTPSKDRDHGYLHHDGAHV